MTTYFRYLMIASLALGLTACKKRSTATPAACTGASAGTHPCAKS